MNKAPGGTPDKRLAAQSPAEFVRSVWLELKRVTWPTREELGSAVILTVALVVIIGVFTYVCDQVFGYVFNLVHPIAK